MAVQPERRCVPLEVEMISLHREPRPSSRPRRVRRHRWFRPRVEAMVRAVTGRTRTTPGATKAPG